MDRPEEAIARVQENLASRTQTRWTGSGYEVEEDCFQAIMIEPHRGSTTFLANQEANGSWLVVAERKILDDNDNWEVLSSMIWKVTPRGAVAAIEGVWC